MRVVARIRPAKTSESAVFDPEVLSSAKTGVRVSLEDFTRVTARGPSGRLSAQSKLFDFDASFGTESSTIEVYSTCVKEVVMSSMRGFNTTVFLYGQTGSGKTHTLTGPPVLMPAKPQDKSPSRRKNSESRTPVRSPRISKIMEAPEEGGLLACALNDIFEEALSASTEKFFVNISYVEIYNESVFDLLREGAALEEPLIVAEDSEKGEFIARNAVNEIATSYAEALNLLKRGEKNRRFAETTLNHTSSRSHTIFRVNFEYVDAAGSVFRSSCNFVDLAGSERLGRMDNDEAGRQRMVEGRNINKSLFFLTQIIQSRAGARNVGFVPYRNSALTKLLKNSIGGNAKTLVILCLHSGLSNLEQSISTLRFGSLARTVENAVEKNRTQHDNESLSKLIEGFEVKIAEMEAKLRSGIVDGSPLLKKIQELETQKAFLQNQYQKLLTLPPIQRQEETKEDKLKRSNLHLPSCGSLDFLTLGPADTQPPPLDTKLAQQLLENDLLASLKRRNQALEETMAHMTSGMKDLEDSLDLLKSENTLLFRIVKLLMNEGTSDFLSLSPLHHQHLLENTMRTVENVQIAKVLKTSPRIPLDLLPLKQNNSNLSAESLIDLFRGQNAESSLALNSNSIEGTPLDHWEAQSLVEDPQRLTEQTWPSETAIDPPKQAEKASRIISANYLLRDI